MIRVRTDRQDEFLDWASVLDKGARWRKDALALGFCDDTGKARGVAVLEGFSTDGRECDVHLASDGSRAWATRAALGQAFGYAFRSLGLSRLNAPIEERNVPALVFSLKAGFQFEGKRLGASRNGENMILLGMTAQSCPWLKGGS